MITAQDDIMGKTRFLPDTILTQQQINQLAAKGKSSRWKLR